MDEVGSPNKVYRAKHRVRNIFVSPDPENFLDLIFFPDWRRSEKFENMQNKCVSAPKNHDSQTRDRILCDFLRPEIVRFSPHFRMISLLDCTENLEHMEKLHIQWRRRREVADFCPLSRSNVLIETGKIVGQPRKMESWAAAEDIIRGY